MRRAKFTRQRQAGLMQVDGDDRIAASDPGSHQTGQPHGANPEHNKTLSGLWLYYVKYRAGAGLSSACEGAHVLEWCIVPHFHCETLVRNGKISKGRLLEKGAINRLAVFGMKRRTVSASTVHFQIECAQAVALAVRFAVRTLAAPGIRHHDMVAGLEFRN